MNLFRISQKKKKKKLFSCTLKDYKILVSDFKSGLDPLKSSTENLLNGSWVTAKITEIN